MNQETSVTVVGAGLAGSEAAWQLARRGVSVTLVSSGAIAVGRDALNFPHLSKHIPQKQMLFAVGQPRLMAVYNKILRKKNLD